MFDIVEHNKQLVRANSDKFAELDDARVLITGASGLIGSAIVRFLLERNHELNTANTQIIAQVRSEEKTRKVLADYADDKNLSFLQADIATFGVAQDAASCAVGLNATPSVSDSAAISSASAAQNASGSTSNIQCDYIIHGAAPTASKFFTQNPIETCLAIVDGTYFMLELAAAQNATMLCLSSMEVYGMGNTTYGLQHKLAEADVGYIDPCALRSSYPESKRMAEQLVCAYASERNMDAKIVRLAQTFGAGIPKDDGRVFCQFVRAVTQNKDIVLKTTGASSRMYCGIDDAVTGILTALLHAEAGRAYNLANEQTYCSIKEMAELVADNFGSKKTQVKIEVDKNAPYPPEHHLPLDTQALRALGWQPTQSLKDMFAQLIDYLQD